MGDTVDEVLTTPTEDQAVPTPSLGVGDMATITNGSAGTVCESFICPNFFTTPNTIYVAYIFVRLLMFGFILFLSYRIPKDFLKRFTLYLFIPLFIAEFARLAVEIMFYIQHFRITQQTAATVLQAESIVELIHRLLATFVYYAFLSKSIVVYHGLFLAFLNPEKFEQWKSSFWFHMSSAVPFIILIAMNIPWGNIKNVEIFIRYSCRIILGIAMIPFYLRTVLFLSWKKQQRDTIIDDRSIIRKAKSRLIWFTIYMTFMNIINFFNFLESFFYIVVYINPAAGRNAFFMTVVDPVMLYASIADEFRPVGLLICTLFFVPVYREAILFCRKSPIVFNGSSEIPLKKARLGRIIFRKKRDPEEICRREDFVTVDDGFIEKSALKNEDWTVYSLDKSGVVFVQLPQKLQEYTIDKYPFVFIPIFEEAMRTAEMDLDSFLSLSNELEVDYKPPKTLFFTNTARCASTLFGSMLQHENHSIVIGEHSSLIGISIGYSENYWSSEEVEKLLPALVKVIRKGIPSEKLFVLKGASTEVKLVPFFSKTMPEILHIFMFRKKGIESVEKMLLRDPQQLILARIYQFSPFFTTLFGYVSACEGKSYRELKPKEVKEFSMIVYGAPYSYYKKNQEIFDFDIVWHHELIQNCENVLKPIFEKLGLPLDLLATAKSRLNRDSQQNTFLSQSALAGIQTTQMTEEVKSNLRRYAERFQMEADVSGLFE
ncbi:hypothetical protein FO519_005709 [Halicephalobus sp. NKZ332]|nr:hypothetical protein FO519_005709 [Halicephalobus sp. NKZ332]